MAREYQSYAIVVLFLGIIAAAFTGSGIQYIGIHAECEDGIDNNQNGFIDIGDDGCFEYPYQDGAGEDITDPASRYQGNNYVSLFDYHLQISQPGQDEAVICTALGFGFYLPEDQQKAEQWINENAVDCSPYLP